MGLPVPPAAVRAGALVELAIAAGALVGGGRLVRRPGRRLLHRLRRVRPRRPPAGTPLSTCGCFGTPDTPPTGVHLGLNLAAAGVALAVALTGSGAGGLGEVASMDGSVLLRVAFLASTAVSVWLAYVALTLLPKMQAAR